MQINSRKIGLGQPTYIIAEISANHNRGFSTAQELIKAAKEAGADAVKVQTYTADTLTIKSEKRYFKIQRGTLWDGRTLYDLYQEASMPWEWQPRLKRYADRLGIDFFSSAFDPTSVDFLEKMNVPAFKIASFELVDIPLIEKIAKTKKPMIISTGMASLGEIKEAVLAARRAGTKQIALLKCTSAYPAPLDEMNLRVIPFLIREFNVPVGLSDHTMGSVAALGAVALGASIIEKHFTLSRKSKGPDSVFSAEPAELRQMVMDIRALEQSLGKSSILIGKKEKKNRIFRRSLFVIKNIARGEKFSADNVRSIRPAHGLKPKFLKKVIGRTARRSLKRGSPLSHSAIL
ncbi:MAG TPA: pseudaminic acid synthase [Candidatus Omnitrophota bacterium]|nr:pseudaminic acid synthase [Candidatus Omnitrophota bacterium]